MEHRIRRVELSRSATGSPHGSGTVADHVEVLLPDEMVAQPFVRIEAVARAGVPVAVCVTVEGALTSLYFLESN